MNHLKFDKSNMDNYVENILAENLTLQRKLDSKCQALTILNKELSECIVERDQYRLMAEQLKKKLSYSKYPMKQNCFADKQEECTSNSSGGKDGNRNSVFEIENLRQKLRDALGDIKALRSQLNQQKSPIDNSDAILNKVDKEEELVKQLENMSNIKSQLESDLESLLDEKEELISERDAYKCKIHRLNHEFNMLLKGDNRNIIDLDALITENRFLQENFQQAQEELKLAHKDINKYKALLGNKHCKSSTKIGIDNLSEMLLSQKQVQDLTQICSGEPTSSTSVTVNDVKSICLALLENLNDKTLALVHQKKTNRILASRIGQLEHKIENLQGSSVFAFPSQILLEGYAGSDLNKEISETDLKERPESLSANPEALSEKTDDSNVNQ